ncbi:MULTISPECIES: hypothetical protein [Streptomyces]|uniref:hypothetical protein n=1 Tax=Streptomyces TaxID=1883 RepID=UPI001D14E3C0|nr:MULTISPECIES: hypothetical protein [Streptomyces]MCC3655652.1 hypothetical protein [Streptomyces sp. S07_1.15]WSQ70036.1 hypothetical protein OG463_00425 [Streptomyces xinghaiensis]
MSGSAVPPGDEPRTLAEKITWLLENAFPAGGGPGGSSVPSDRQVVQAINERAGRHVIGHTTFWKLRTGKTNPETGRPYTASDDILQGIAEFFDVDPRFFKTRSEVVGQVVESLRFLRSVHNGDITGIAGRGIGDEGLSRELLAFMNEVLADFRDGAGAEAAPGTGTGGTAGTGTGNPGPGRERPH